MASVCATTCLFVQVRREKAIYHTLNKLSMDTSRKVLLAEAWCPLAAKPHVHEALRRAAQDSSTQVCTCSAADCVCGHGEPTAADGQDGQYPTHGACLNCSPCLPNTQACTKLDCNRRWQAHSLVPHCMNVSRSCEVA